jgi:chaperonin GroEL
MNKQDAAVPATTRVIFSSDARKLLFRGVDVVANAVGCTLGPKGKTVLIQQGENSAPVVTKDGVTVSKSIKLKHSVERMGAQLIRQAAEQTNETAGDGTTTSTVLTHAMVKTGMKLLEAGYDSKDLCDGIEKSLDVALGYLKKEAKQLSSNEEITQIATISANGDRKIGELIAEAMTKVGNDGIITVEEARGMTTSLEIVEGMQFDRGYLSPYFVTNSEKMLASYNDAKILLVDHKLNNMRDMVPLLEKVSQSKTPLLIVADDVEGEALQGLVVNRVNGSLPVVAIRSPGYGQHKEELLRDISVMTGAKIVSPSTGLKMQQVTMADLGSLKKFVVSRDACTLVSNGSTKDKVERHVTELKQQLRDVSLTFDEVNKLKTRIAKLASGVALIKVGGSTEVEMIERKYRIEDALHATRAAVEEGIVPGGGMALFEVWHQMHSRQVDPVDEFGYGAKVVLDACLAPIGRIAENAGESKEVIINELNKHRSIGQKLGWNAAVGSYQNLIDVGVIDPVKVTRSALKNAASVAVTFLSLDAVIVEEKSDAGV